MLKKIKRKLWYWKMTISLDIAAIVKCARAMKKYKALEKVQSTPQHTEAMMDELFNPKVRAAEAQFVEELVERITELVNRYIEENTTTAKYIVVNKNTKALLMQYDVADTWEEVEVLESAIIGDNIEVVG